MTNHEDELYPELNLPDLSEEISDEELQARMDAAVSETDDDLDDFLLGMEALKKPRRENKIVVPEGLAAMTGFSGDIYGAIRPDSGYHVILGWEGSEPVEELQARCIGRIETEPAAPDTREPVIIGRWENGELRFTLYEDGDATELTTDVYLLKQDLFSRNSGLMESDWMGDKCVVLSGVGSVGSLLALHMARSGVGKFVLVDTDCVEIHNVCRHQCSLKDVGRYKVDAVAERILQINPAAQILKFYRRVQDVSVDEYADWVGDPRKALFIGTCDNRVGNAFACDAAFTLGAAFMAQGFMARAWGFELFIALPNNPRHICYRCAFRSQLEEAAAQERRNHNYIGVEDVGVVPFIPGLDVDIEYGVSIASKCALDILNRFNRDYHFRLVHTLNQVNVFSGTGDRTGAEPGWSEILPEPLDHRSFTIADTCRREECSFCGRKPTEE